MQVQCEAPSGEVLLLLVLLNEVIKWQLSLAEHIIKCSKEVVERALLAFRASSLQSKGKLQVLNVMMMKGTLSSIQEMYETFTEKLKLTAFR